MVKKEVERKEIEYDYYELLRKAREFIDAEYGGISKFVASPDFSKCGFSVSDASKFSTYLSLPKEGKKGVRSLPTLELLYKGLFGIELASKIEVERKQVITVIGELPEQLVRKG